MLQQFLQDISIPGCIVQFGEANNVLGFSEAPLDEAHFLFFDDFDLYFLGGVDPASEKTRASNDNIKLKNYIYFDFDIRKAKPEISDEEIKLLAENYYKPALEKLLPDWRYIVFTGNGLHIYLFADKPFTVANKDRWKLGMRALIRELQTHFPEDIIDESCVNLARIARLPGSFNHKTQPQKKVEIIAFQEKYSAQLCEIELRGEGEEKRMLEQQQKTLQELTAKFPATDNVYSRIQALPIAEVVCRVMSWIQTGRHFQKPGSAGKSACFVSTRGNFLVHGGTSHIPAGKEAYYPFELVKAIKNYDNAQAFFWFKKEFPQVVTEVKKEERNIGSVFQRLENHTFTQMKLNDRLDEYKFLIRGAVTRIGGMSYHGKSKMAYFLANELLGNGYRGLIFSTEVPSEMVLANLLMMELDVTSVWDILRHTVKPGEKEKRRFEKLEIYDVKDTQNELFRMEEKLKESIFWHAKQGLDAPSFVIIDFVQMVMPKSRTFSEFHQASRYAQEIQEMAQRHNVCILDLSQLSSLKAFNDFEDPSKPVPFLNSSALYSNADIAVWIQKGGLTDTNKTVMKFSLRKHKYGFTKELEFHFDYRRGSFELSPLYQF